MDYKFTDTILNCKNFKWSEFFRSENDFKKSSIQIKKNIIILASSLQRLRDYLGLPIHITSGYRDPDHNASVGGEPNSWHTKALAIDCWFSGLTLEKSKEIFVKKFFTGVIFYPKKRIVHLDLRYTISYFAVSYKS